MNVSCLRDLGAYSDKFLQYSCLLLILVACFVVHFMYCIPILLVYLIWYWVFHCSRTLWCIAYSLFTHYEPYDVSLIYYSHKLWNIALQMKVCLFLLHTILLNIAGHIIKKLIRSVFRAFFEPFRGINYPLAYLNMAENTKTSKISCPFPTKILSEMELL